MKILSKSLVSVMIAVGSVLAAMKPAMSAVTAGFVSDNNEVTISGTSGSWGKNAYPGTGYYYKKGQSCAAKSTYTASRDGDFRFLGWYTMADDDTSKYGTASLPSDCTVEVCSTEQITYTELVDAVSSTYLGTHVVCPKYQAVYSVTATPSPENAGSVFIETSDEEYEEDGMIAEDEDCALTAKAKSGYSFVNWTKGTKKKCTDLVYEFTVSSSTKGAYVANFTNNVYEVELYPTYSSSSSVVVSATYNEDMPAVPTAQLPTRTGYTFDGYFEKVGGQGTRYYNGDGTSAHIWDKPSGATLQANWTVNEYDLKLEFNAGIVKIKYRIDGGSLVEVTEDTTVKVPYGSKWSAYATAEEGYKASGDVEDRTMYEEGATYSPTVTLDGYALTVDPNGGQYLGSSDPTMIAGLRLKENTTNLNAIGVATYAGHRLNGYYCNNELVYDSEGHNVNCSYWYGAYPSGRFIGSASVSVVARWRDIILYTIAFNANGGKGEMNAVENVDYELDQQLPLNQFTNGIRTFSHWTTTVDNVAVEFEDGATVRGLTSVNGSTNTLYAVWNNEYAFAFNGNGETSGSMPAQLIANKSGLAETLRANEFSRDGYTFAGWTTNSTSTQIVFADQAELTTEPTFVEIGKTNTLYAVWSPIEYAVAFDRGEGEGEMSDQQFTYGVAQNLIPNTFTRSGFWTFGCWTNKASGATYEDGEAVSNLATIAGEKVTLTAHWKSTLSDLAVAMKCWNLDWHNFTNLEWVGCTYWEVNPNGGVVNEGVYSWVLTSSAITNSGSLSFQWKSATTSDSVRFWIDEAPDVLTAPSDKFLLLTGHDSWQTFTTNIQLSTSNQKPLYLHFENAEVGSGAAYLNNMTWTIGGVQPAKGDEAKIAEVKIEGGKFKIAFESDDRFNYNLMTNGDLSVDSWGVMTNLPGTGSTQTFDPQIPADAPQLFYRIETTAR